MADPDEIQSRAADPFVRARADAGSPRPGLVTLAGLLGDSDRDGRRRLYLTTRLDYFVEFKTEDVVAVEDIAPEAAPFPGLDATRVTLAGGATLDWVRQASGAADPLAHSHLFAVDAQSQEQEQQQEQHPTHTWEARCPAITVVAGQSDLLPCQGGAQGTGGEAGTVRQVPTMAGHTCATCNLRNTCNACTAATCATCGQATCAITCNAATCATCQGVRCVSAQGTCQTCGRATCEAACAVTAGNGVSCDATCATCWDTCAGTCLSCRGTCDATCANTCVDTCASTCAATCWATCETCNTCNFATCGCRASDPAWCPIRA
ncbi:MAG: hypothetical protein QM619_03570 [Micropruina sp.]|uniref:hypothetical protein n=1 Tax=Micropruina sp. TaxID=2737536 RepID=UPI0039E3226A